jgi:hypothetical protein
MPGLVVFFILVHGTSLPGQVKVDGSDPVYPGCRLVWPSDMAVADIGSVEPDLEVPATDPGQPGPGRRVRQTTPGFPEQGVHHTLYLPPDWEPGRKFPVIIEWTGNRYGSCTGLVEDAKLGYGISGGEGFIWICMPFLDGAGRANVDTWWGDEGAYQTRPTIEYCIRTVDHVCRHWGGDPGALVLAGFSRGSIACNYIGLANDEIAGLWRAFICYSHYDGLYTGWPYPDCDREAARERLDRLQGRPQFICQEIVPRQEDDTGLVRLREYIRSTGIQAPFTYCLTGFRDHDDAWILRPSEAREALRRWLQGQL